MAITFTAGYDNIWNHFDRNPEPDDIDINSLVVLRAEAVSGGGKIGVDIELGGVAVEVDLINKGPNFPNAESLIGRNLSEVFSLYDSVPTTESTTLINGLISQTIQSDQPVLQRDWDPDGTDLQGLINFYSGNDTFYGASAVVTDPFGSPSQVNDDVNGWAGNDTFWGRIGDDRFVGGDGLDTIRFEGQISQFSISQQNVWNDSLGESFPGWRFADVTGAEGTDEATGVERAIFSDATVALDLNGVGGQAYRIYKAAFDREPDSGGLGYWIAQMDNGMDMVEVAARFIDSDEFRLLYGTNPTNGQFLTKVYNNVLDRDPDAGGYAWWIDQLENNPEKTWQKVLADFSESPENQTNVADLIAEGIVFDPWLA